MKIAIDGERLMAELHTLATFSEPAAEPALDPSDTAVTRVVFTAHDLEARAWLDGLAAEAGLRRRQDAVGNTFYRWQGSEPELAAVATGSHIDAIPNAGMYDGTVGVLGGLEAIRALQACGFKPRRSIESILFTSEEPTRFGIGCLGSRLMSGALSASNAYQLTDKEGRSLRDAQLEAGFSGLLESVKMQPGHYSCFVELHIEQGPELEAAGVQIGIVTAIAAPASGMMTVTGSGGHAGAMLMPVRRDALTAAAEIVLAVERAALATGATDTVATVGMCEVFPGAVNSVPSKVKLSLDVRDIDLERRDGVLASIASACEQIAARRGVSVSDEVLNMDSPASCNFDMLTKIEVSCAEAGCSSRRMISRAYHDSLFMARICPVAMIFVPSRGGVSHRPDEFSSAEDIGAGVEVLAGTLARLSGAG